MAHWISSKLKVAENLLHQIDQQAAESLRKGERKQSDDDGLDIGDTSPKPSGSLSLRDQLKTKKNSLNESGSSSNSSEALAKLRSDNNNNIGNSSNDKAKENEDGKKIGKGVVVVVPEINVKNTNALNDSDWTELLSTPKSGKTVKGGRGVRKVGGKGNVKGKGVGVVRKDEKVNGAGDGRREREEGGSLGSTPRVSGVGLEDRGNEDSVERKKEREVGKVEKSVGKGELPGVLKEGRVGRRSNGGSIDEGYDKSKEAVSDDRRVKRVASAVDKLRSSKSASYLGTDDESGSESGSYSSSDSESEREREERRQIRQQRLAAKAAAKAADAMKEQENLVARLEGEKQSLEKILEEQAKKAVQEASELQSTMMETMEAAELEKQKHNNTRMEILAQLAKLESANADLTKSLATVQWNLENEVNRLSDLRQQVDLKGVAIEDLRRRTSCSHQPQTSSSNFMPSKGIELEMLEAEYSFLVDKTVQLQDKAMKLESNIDLTLKEMENPTEVEVELKQRLGQMTDHLIQKQAQVESLSSDKAMLLFRIEAVSRLLEENQSLLGGRDLSGSSREDLEAGAWDSYGSQLRPMFKDKIQSGKQHLGSLLTQLDAIFSAGQIFLSRNPAAKVWSLVYLVCLHFWVLYILFSHSQPTEKATSSSVMSLENINSTHGV